MHFTPRGTASLVRQARDFSRGLRRPRSLQKEEILRRVEDLIADQSTFATAGPIRRLAGKYTLRRCGGPTRGSITGFAKIQDVLFQEDIGRVSVLRLASLVAIDLCNNEVALADFRSAALVARRWDLPIPIPTQARRCRRPHTATAGHFWEVEISLRLQARPIGSPLPNGLPICVWGLSIELEADSPQRKTRERSSAGCHAGIASL